MASEKVIKYNHKRYFAEGKYRKTISKFEIRTGMIVHFPYPGPYDRKPTVFVMDTNETGAPDKKSFSGVNLDYIPIREVNKFFIRLLSKMGWEVDRRTRFPRGRLYDEEVGGIKPIAIYNTIVKKALLNKRDCWRTYKYSKIRRTEQVKFKFFEPPLNQIWQDGFEKLNRVSKGDMTRLLKENHRPKDINFNNPNFDLQWKNLLNFKEFEKMGKMNSRDYVNSNSKIYRFTTVKKYLKNIHVNFDKLKRTEKLKFDSDYKKGNLDMPVVVKFNDNDYKLISGQINLAGCYNLNINTKIWLIDLTKYYQNKERYDAN